MWRPKGWDNPYTYKNLEAKPIGSGIDFTNVPEVVAYEAGADAMLSALRRMGSRAGRFIYEDGFVKETPLIVIIPDDDKE